MAKKSSATKTKAKKKQVRRFRPGRFVFRWGLRAVSAGFLLAVFLVVLWGVVNPPSNFYMMGEKRRLGDLDHHWVPLEEVAPVMARSVVAAEDANFWPALGI